MENTETKALLEQAAETADNNGTKMIIYTLLGTLETNEVYFRRLINITGIFTKELWQEIKCLK